MIKTPAQAPIISTREARRLLGKDYEDLSDKDIEALITHVELMAEIAVKRIKEDKSVPNST